VEIIGHMAVMSMGQRIVKISKIYLENLLKKKITYNVSFRYRVWQVEQALA
jgi:hypothetical protein